jgi:hypothetical protein
MATLKSKADRPPELLRHPPPPSTFAGPFHGLFKAFAERRLARQLRNLFRLDATVRTVNPIQLNHYRGAVLKAGRIAHLPLTDVADFRELPPATGADQLPIAALAPNPQLQRLAPLVDFVTVDPVAQPPKNSAPLVVPNPAKCNQSFRKSKCLFNQWPLQIPVQRRLNNPERRVTGGH